MNAITYQLAMYDTAGRNVPAKLTYRFQDDQPVSRETASKFVTLPEPPPTAEFTLFMLDGTLEIPSLTGPSPVKVSGICFVSLLGPTLATIFTGAAGQGTVSMEFNMIDSPGKYIGGGLSWQADRNGDNTQPWCFLGARQG